MAQVETRTQVPAGPLRSLLRWGMRVAASMFPKRPRLFQLRVRGLDLVVLLNEHIGRRLLLARSFEQDVFDELLRHVRAGDVCVDVGANVGYVSMQLARQCGPGGAVFAFEPIRRNALIAQINADLNGFAHVEVIERPVSDEDGVTLSSARSEEDSAFAYFTDRNGGAGLASLTLDTFAAERGLHRIDVLKIDVEGAELKVLRGARRLLASSGRPRLVLIEIVPEHLERFGTVPDEVHELMAQCGYSAFVARDARLVAATPQDLMENVNVFFQVSDR